jgi:CubicO group peptidase (beta-lactamase class C family)
MPAGSARSSRSVRVVTVLLALATASAACSSDDSGQASAETAPPTTAATEAGTDTTATDDTADADADADDVVVEEGPVWPVPDWERVGARAAGFDRRALGAVARRAEAGGTTCLVVTRDGELVDEWYWGDGAPEVQREAFSVTKSITSTLVGIAADRGDLDIDDSASTWIDEWVGTPSEAVTVRNLLANDSGRFQTFESDYVDMVGSPDRNEFSVGLEQQHEPGTEWVYNNAAIQTLDVVIEEATGMPTRDFAEEALFDPIGMDDTELSTDPSGNTNTFMGAQTTCRDLARFGLLFLRNGKWDGEQVVSRRWVREATTPSQDLNPEYGFLWWLNPGGDEEGTGPGAGNEEGDVRSPADSYAALGLQNQVVAVFPSSGIVVTRMGWPAEDGTNFGISEIVAGVLPALDEEP